MARRATSDIGRPCRSCGTVIHFVALSSGRRCPVEGPALAFEPGGSEVLVTDAGEIVRGTVRSDGQRHGRRSHFATCPAAKEHRRRA